MKTDKKIVALCTSRIYDSQVCGFIEELNEKLKNENVALMIFTINSDLYWDDDKISAETSVFDIIPYEVIDAVVIMDEKIKNHTIANNIISASKEHNKPVVIVDGYYEGVLHVNFDYGSGFEAVVRHVLNQRDIKKPHIMAGIPDNPFSDERIEIFKKVITEYGFTFDDSMLSYGQFWAVPARREMERIVESGDIPDAIICANDIMAINVCDVLHQHGISVPEDVLVSGFDGYDEVFITTPKITTVSCTTPELAEATAGLVFDIINCATDNNTTDKNASNNNAVDNNASNNNAVDNNVLLGDISVIPTLITNESTGCESQSGYDHYMLSRFNNMFYRHNDATRVMHEVSTSMQMSRNPKEMVSQLSKLIVNDQNVIMDVSFVLNRNIFDIDNYFFDSVGSEIKMEDYSVVYDANVSPYLSEKSVEGTLLRPENENFWKKIESGYPLIFNTIDYMNTPLGFICFNYQDYDITKYSRTANVTNTISMGVGGFINMRYQNSLTKKVGDMFKTDSLTGLYNRLGFRNVFEKLKDNQNLWGKNITVIMTDLDGLKYINDTFGHAEGDIAIQTAAKALKKACPENAICVRFGGDELFSVIIGDCSIDTIINGIESFLEAYNKSSDKEYSVVSSCGGNTFVLDENFDLKKALKKADEQMYNMKREHRKNMV